MRLSDEPCLPLCNRCARDSSTRHPRTHFVWGCGRLARPNTASSRAPDPVGEVSSRVGGTPVRPTAYALTLCGL
eukprot:5302610-Pyramimonas_sp.AAC.1